MDRKISGIALLIVGIILVVLGFFLTFVFYIYGGICLLVGIFSLLNKSEDKIEQINHKGGKK